MFFRYNRHRGGLGMFAFHGDNFRKRIPAGSAGAYAFATFCVATAGIIRWTIGIFVEGVVPFAAFFPGPGIFAAVMGGVIGWWAFLDPPKTFLPLTVAQQISLIFYLLTSLVIVWAADHYQNVTKRLEDEQRFRELAVEELAHRLKTKLRRSNP